MALVDFTYIEDAPTPDDALSILRSVVDSKPWPVPRTGRPRRSSLDRPSLDRPSPYRPRP